MCETCHTLKDDGAFIDPNYRQLILDKAALARETDAVNRIIRECGLEQPNPRDERDLAQIIIDLVSQLTRERDEARNWHDAHCAGTESTPW